MSERALEKYRKSEADFRNLEDLTYFAKAHLETKGPGDVLTPALIARYGLKDRQAPNKSFQRSDTFVGGGCGGYGWYGGFGDVDAAGCGGGTGDGGGKCKVKFHP